MTNNEQDILLRATLESICRGTTDVAAIGKRALEYAQVLDCPSAIRLPPAELAKRLFVTRQAIYKKVDKAARELAEIKGDCQRPG